MLFTTRRDSLTRLCRCIVTCLQITTVDGRGHSGLCVCVCVSVCVCKGGCDEEFDWVSATHSQRKQTGRPLQRGNVKESLLTQRRRRLLVPSCLQQKLLTQ